MVKVIKMKRILFLTMVFAVQACTAGPTPRVEHSHNARVHNHSLPPSGVGHRHGGSLPGVMTRDSRQNNNGSITSSVVYGENNSSDPRANANHQPRQRSNPPPVSKPKIISRTNTQRKNTNIRKGGGIKGDASCRKGEPNCNVCASNVQQQFNQAVSNRIKWRTKPWRFTWPQKYPPFNKRPLDIFDGDAAYALGIPDTHIQGFARTNSARFPFVGSHSHKRKGGVFVVKQESNGRKYLATLHPTKSRHPSGIQVVGDYLVYGEQGRLYFKDLNSHNQRRGTDLSIPKASFGGGLGVLRLQGGDLLLVTTGPGGQASRPRYHRFYQLQSNRSLPTSIKLIGESSSTKPAQWPRGFNFSENLSLITECGTGDIYAIHTSGDEKGIKAVTGTGYWRLSKLKQSQGKLQLAPINAFTMRQNMHSCSVRAAATVYVNSSHRLEFYCHGYAKDPDGSTFNVLGSSSRNADKFEFKAGTL